MSKTPFDASSRPTFKAFATFYESIIRSDQRNLQILCKAIFCFPEKPPTSLFHSVGWGPGTSRLPWRGRRERNRWLL